MAAQPLLILVAQFYERALIVPEICPQQFPELEWVLQQESRDVQGVCRPGVAMMGSLLLINLCISNNIHGTTCIRASCQQQDTHPKHTYIFMQVCNSEAQSRHTTVIFLTRK